MRDASGSLSAPKLFLFTDDKANGTCLSVLVAAATFEIAPSYRRPNEIPAVGIRLAKRDADTSAPADVPEVRS